MCLQLRKWVIHWSLWSPSVIHYYLGYLHKEGGLVRLQYLYYFHPKTSDMKYTNPSQWSLLPCILPLPPLYLLLFLLSPGCQPGWENGLAVLRDLRQPGLLCSAMKGQDFCLQLGAWGGSEHSWQPHSEQTSIFLCPLSQLSQTSFIESWL